MDEHKGIAAHIEHMRLAQQQDHELLVAVLKLLRGDERGEGGLTARIVLLENDLRKFLGEKDKSNARVWQIVAAVIAALVVRVVVAKWFEGK